MWEGNIPYVENISFFIECCQLVNQCHNSWTCLLGSCVRVHEAAVWLCVFCVMCLQFFMVVIDNSFGKLYSLPPPPPIR